MLPVFALFKFLHADNYDYIDDDDDDGNKTLWYHKTLTFFKLKKKNKNVYINEQIFILNTTHLQHLCKIHSHRKTKTISTYSNEFFIIILTQASLSFHSSLFQSIYCNMNTRISPLYTYFMALI